MRKIGLIIINIMLLINSVFSYTCLTFNSEKKAINAEKQVWINKIKDTASKGDGLVGDGVIHYNANSIMLLTNNEIFNLKKYSFINGKIQYNSGYTTNYSTIKKSYELDKWYFKKPEVKYMIDIINYIEEEYNKDWVESIEI